MVRNVLFRRVCPGCGRAEPGLCRHCVGSAQAVGAISGLADLDAVAALYRYDGAVRRLVLGAKNGGRRDILAKLGVPLAALVSRPGSCSGQPATAAPGSSPFDIVTWVPASKQGVRRRGYDQGRLLAQAVAAELAAPCRHLLVRRRGAPQTGRDRVGRQDGPLLRAPVASQGRVLVVDDVITTGGSLCAAGTALRAAGASSVAAVAVAWNASVAEVISGRPVEASFARSVEQKRRAAPNNCRA